MKKLINDPRDVADEALEGFAAAHSDIVSVSFSPPYIRRVDSGRERRVAIVSGGGTGHEPLHGGFVGYGMLDAAVPGQIFSSPTPNQILAAVKAVDAGAGVLLIVKNYTGDVLNFEIAAEFASADGIDVRTVVVNDDVAVRDSAYTAGRRGVAGTLLVEKIAGAAAQRGDPIDAIVSIAQKVIDRVRSMGVALAAGTVPTSEKPSFELGLDEIEFGVGIHGEPGRERAQMRPVDALVESVLDSILDDLPVEPGSRVILVVNGLGSTPLIELYLVFRRAAMILTERGVEIAASLVGSYVTSLDMQGFSLSLLTVDDELLHLWNAPVHTPALRWGR